MTLSRKSKEAIKTALAMTIAYGIALQMGWENPKWAGFAVAFVSLATLGQSLNKGAMRMLGTLVAAVVALMIIALSAQDRWLFMLFLSAWVGFCTYMMGGPKRQYFWNVCGFVCVIICLDAGPDSINAFETAMVRTEETGLGILVYSLVAVLIWPSISSADFDAAAVKLASTQHRQCRSYLSLMKGEGSSKEAQSLRSQEIHEQSRFGQLLDAAETDSYEVWELRQEWRNYERKVAELTETMERWRLSIADLQEVDLQRLLPNLSRFDAQLNLRFAQIERMLANQPPKQYPTVIDLSLEDAEVRALRHSDKAALAVTRTRLQHLEALTRSLFDAVQDLKGYGPANAVRDATPPHRAAFAVDPDGVAGVVRAMATMWLAYLAFIYVDDIPGGTGFVIFAGILGMALGTKPQLPVSLLFVPAAVSVMFAGVFYIFVMPQLSSFTILGPLIFAVTFVLCYLFAAPEQALGKIFGLAMFVNITSISNDQTYSFLSVANIALMFPLIFLLLAITAYIPFSPLPQRAFLRLLGRFFHSCEYLISAMRWDPQYSVTPLKRCRKTFHAHEVSTLPRKLEAWALHIDSKMLPGTSPQQVQAVVSSMQALTYRMHEVLEVNDDTQAQFVAEELLSEIRSWRLEVQRTFRRLSDDPAVGDQEAFSSRLAEITDNLEDRIKRALDKATDAQIDDNDSENTYRLLGAYRGVSEALVEYASNASVISWAQWREGRF
jgi:uncharacterized membrane protein YccC